MIVNFEKYVKDDGTAFFSSEEDLLDVITKFLDPKTVEVIDYDRNGGDGRTAGTARCIRPWL